MPLDPDDLKLSHRIAPPSRDPVNNVRLRALLVKRLSETWKSVLRVPLRRAGRTSIFCEHCDRWNNLEDVPQQWLCPECGTEFVIELVVYEEKAERDMRLTEERHKRRTRQTPDHPGDPEQ
jgi:hypothetical protein